MEENKAEKLVITNLLKMTNFNLKVKMLKTLNFPYHKEAQRCLNMYHVILQHKLGQVCLF